MIHPAHSHCAARRAFTLLEVILALSIASFVGFVSLLMLDGALAGAREEDDTRSATVRRQVVHARLGSELRAARMLLDQGDRHLVVWTHDAAPRGRPNLSELRRLEWDADAASVLVYEAPESLDESLDASWALDDDFGAVTAVLAGGATFPGRVILSDVTNWVSTIDSTEPRTARLLRVRVSTRHGSGEDATTVVVAPRLFGD